MDKNVETFMEYIVERNPGEKEFHQAVQEVVESILPYINKHPKYQKANVTALRHLRRHKPCAPANKFQ